MAILQQIISQALLRRPDAYVSRIVEPDQLVRREVPLCPPAYLHGEQLVVENGGIFVPSGEHRVRIRGVALLQPVHSQQVEAGETAHRYLVLRIDGDRFSADQRLGKDAPSSLSGASLLPLENFVWTLLGHFSPVPARSIERAPPSTRRDWIGIGATKGEGVPWRGREREDDRHLRTERLSASSSRNAADPFLCSTLFSPFPLFLSFPSSFLAMKIRGRRNLRRSGNPRLLLFCSGRVNEDEREETRAETKSAKPTSNSRHADTERSPRPFHACAHPSVPVLSTFHSAQLHPADTLSPLSSPAPPLSPRRPLLVAPTPPPLRLITTLIHHHRGDLFSLFSFFVPILFLYPRISFSFPLLLSFILSFLSSRKERKLSSLFHLLLSLSRTFQHILFFSPFLLLLNPFSDFEGSIQCSRYSNSSQRVEYIVWKSDGAMCSTTLCPDTTYRGYDKRDAIRGAIPENWEIIPEAKNWNDRIEEKIDTRTFRSISRACIRWSFIETVFIFPLFLFRTNITELYKNCLKHSISRREYSWLRFLTVFFRYFPIYNKKSIKSIEASLVRVNSRKGIYIYLDRGSIQCGKMSIRVVWSILFSSPATDPIYLKRDKTFNGIIT